MCPGPSNCVPIWPISVVTSSSWYTSAFLPKPAYPWAEFELGISTTLPGPIENINN